MSALAVATGAVNLGQGFPDYPGAAGGARRRAGGDRHGRRPVPARARASPAARGRRRAYQRRFRGLDLRPRPSRCWSPPGATEALDRGPAGPARRRRRGRALRADVRQLRRRRRDGGRRRPAGAAAPAGRQRGTVDLRSGRGPGRGHPAHQAPAAQHAAQPHRQGLRRRRTACPGRAGAAHDLLVLTDEVYEHLVFSGAEHRSIATLPGHARADPGGRQRAARRSTSPAGRSAGSAGRRPWSRPSAPPSSSSPTSTGARSSPPWPPVSGCPTSTSPPSRAIWSTGATCWCRGCRCRAAGDLPAGHLLRDGRRPFRATRRRRPGVLPVPAGADRGRGDPHRGLLRPGARAPGPAPGAVRVLQARRGAGRGRARG